MKTLLVMVMVLGMGFFAVNAEAFCIYNKTDTTIKFHQTRGGSTSVDQFSGKLGPGGKQCCNWKNSDCNDEGKRYALVAFHVFVKSADLLRDYTLMCEDVTIQAGGWLTVEGKKGNYKCVRHDY
jgi:hypothetical protein